ncbi:peroxiredoxin family protein [Mucilaginibacter sp. OK098]|uniref:peroxiredoxin family protein n=1 Tax=Mucilaginibacter sp. OK098 TaxID=1855297 RepID=UPI00091176C0|nr:TlpA disulfide reductase family protein [Mucilaginibacter sp. OK098]SHM69721.1 Peroxiredoxin [Mucilaginibacter sp. OK098]
MLLKSRLILSILLTFSILSTASAQVKLKTGIWRGILKNESKHELPFNFEVSNVAGHQQIAIINGAEHYKVPDVTTKGDSVFVKMPLFDSEFRLKLVDANLSGNWIRHLGDHDSALPFSAAPNTSWRFLKDPQKPAFNVTGRWAAVFGEGTDGRDELVGEFKQTGNKLTGTFLSTTGDYRYLEGSVSGDRLYLSCFDGCHAFLFTAKITSDKVITDGENYSGYSAFTKWTAIKNANAKLPDAYSLTALKPGFKKIAFTFPDINGHKVSLSDARFKNKVVIVQILGSWCPNCMDETNFIINSGYYKKYHAKGVEVIGLAYERTADFKKSQKTLAQLNDHFKIPYPLLITGFTPSKGDPMKSLPALADFKGFPTTIIIDKKGNVRKIHTGFNGPGTGEHYTEFVVEFDKLTEDLLAEKG